MTQELQQELAQKFQKMHTSHKILVLPNAWDAGSCVIFEREGFEAIGTTSAGMSYSLGLSDGEFLTIDDILDATRKMQRRITAALSVDIERGYGKTHEKIVKNVQSIIQEGVVGINIEDGISFTNELTPLDEQCKIIQDLAQLKIQMNIDFVINARTDTLWLGIGGNREEQLSLSINRCNRYLSAGADCVFVPGSLNKEEIAMLVKQINGPLNIIATPSCPTIHELESLGVARVSLGSGPVRAALAVIKNIAHEVKNEGTFHTMYTTTIAYDEANDMFN